MNHKKGILIGIIVGLLMAALPVEAQMTGWLHSAKPLDLHATDVGGYLGLFDGAGKGDMPIAVFGQIRHGLFANGDGGLKIGLADSDSGADDVGLLIAGDLQWALLAPRWGDPFYLSTGPEIALIDGDGARIWAFGGNVAVSHDLLIRASQITFYGRLNLRLEVIDYEHKNWSTDTDLEIGLNPGFIWKATEFFDIVGEVQFDDQIGVLGGFNFRI